MVGGVSEEEIKSKIDTFQFVPNLLKENDKPIFLLPSSKTNPDFLKHTYSNLL